jgi:hypothetical protein
MAAHDILPAVAGMISQINTGETKMALPTNDDFANCELSIEELEAIAAGWPRWLHTVGHIAADIGTGTGKFLLNAAGVAILAVTGAAVVGGILGGGGQSLTTNRSMN